jgi:DNA-binding transcriptional ArsR family regulator
MLRILLTSDDLLHTRIAARPDPLFEIVASVRQLRSQGTVGRLGPWPTLPAASRPLLELVPAGTAVVPDFLTPAKGSPDLETGIDTVLSTPPRQLCAELAAVAREAPLPGWTRALAAGDPAELNRLGAAIRAYHRAAVAPHWPRVEAHVAADRAVRGQAILDRGVGQVLSSLHANLRWTPGQLCCDCGLPGNFTVVPDGHGLVLQPTYFAYEPMILNPANGPAILAYPVIRPSRSRNTQQPLIALLGQTRAAVLAALRTAATTTELAGRVGIAPSSASEHASVLRDAGLVVSHRTGPAMLHMLTPLGSRLLQESASPGVRDAVNRV